MSAATAAFPIDWDAWRAGYDQLSFPDQQAFYQHVAELHPEQRSFDVAKARQFFARYQPATVVELGGWDGALASRILSVFEVTRWRNYDLVRVPQACTHPGYQLLVLDEPFWEGDAQVVADAFVATHTIEHIRAHELERIVGTLGYVNACLIEAPLLHGPRDWTAEHYPGSHILEIGWNGVDDIFAAAGYLVDYAWPAGRFYTRGAT